MTPQLLKSALTEALNELLAPIQAEYQASEEWQKTTDLAYPAEVKVAAKKEKKSKGGDPALREAAQAARAAQAAQQADKSAPADASHGIETLKIDAETKTEL